MGSRDDSIDKLTSENAQLRHEVLKLTQKLVDVENERAELEADAGGEFHCNSILKSLDEANKLKSPPPAYKTKLKPVVSSNSLKDAEVINRITHYVETVNRHFRLDYQFNFKNARQFEYMLKLLKDRMREETTKIEFLCEVRDEYKLLLDSKCRQYHELHKRYNEGDSGRNTDAKEESTEKTSQVPGKLEALGQEVLKGHEVKENGSTEIEIALKLKSKVGKLKEKLAKARTENGQLKAQLEDHCENRKSILKQKELLYDQYSLLQEENDKLKQQEAVDGLKVLNEHIVDTLVKFLECMVKNNYNEARVLLTILGSHISVSTDKSKVLTELFNALEKSRSRRS